MHDIEFDADDARDKTAALLLWPISRDEHEERWFAPYRQWWTRLLSKVTDAVNEHDWHDQTAPGEPTEIAELAADQQVAEARKQRRVLALCQYSEVDQVIDDPMDEDIYQRLTSVVLDTGVDGTYRYGGEDAEEYAERMDRARRSHRDQCLLLLRLGTVAETYLTAAAVRVAEAWCKDEIERWKAANPEPEDDE